MQVSLGARRAYAAGAGAGAAPEGVAQRFLGFRIPYSWLLGGSLGTGGAVYSYETLHAAREKGKCAGRRPSG